jgi:multidrug efflux pump subunit AcrB
MAFLIQAMLVAVGAILLILVSQFNSVVKPILIGITILFSTIGVFGGFATFKMDFIIIMTGIGIISLAGIVVNNAIVLIDYIDYLKKIESEKRGLSEDENLPLDVIDLLIEQAGKTRLRPVLLTAITTVLGLVPMALGLNIDILKALSDFDPNIYFGGDNADFWAPMAWTVIYGLTFSTILTLVVVPAMYREANHAKIWIQGLFPSRANTKLEDYQ